MIGRVTGRDRDPLSVAAELTPLDRELIRILQANGRAPYAQIARELGTAEKTIRKRVGDLIANDVIQITTVADPGLLGYRAMAFVGLRVDRTRLISDVAAELAELGGVDYVVVTTGRFQLFAEVLAADRKALLATVERDILSVPGVAGGELFPSLRLHYQEPRWEAARWKSGPGGVATDHRLDEMDGRILAELNADGRAPLQGVARRLGASESQVRQRVNRMVGSGTVRILALTNPASLGFRTSAWIGISVAAGVRVGEVAAQVSALGSITYVVVSAGRFDLFAEAICVDDDDLLSVLDEEIRPLPGVARIEAFLYLALRYKRLSAARAPQVGEPHT
jgi:Lrp/AsnC family transcriptional regulator for asnA, asnC and gidA